MIVPQELLSHFLPTPIDRATLVDQVQVMCRQKYSLCLCHRGSLFPRQKGEAAMRERGINHLFVPDLLNMERWVACTKALDRRLRSCFHKLGLVCATRPWWTIVVVLGIVLLSSLGLLRVKEENRVEKLWVPQGSAALTDQRYVDEHFGLDPRAAVLIVTTQPPGGSVLDKSVLLPLLTLHQRLVGGPLPTDQRYTDLCFHAYRGGPCVVDSLLSLWSFNESALLADADVARTVAHAAPVTVTGLPFMVPSVLSNKTTALRITYLLNSSDALNAEVLEWEGMFLKVAGEPLRANVEMLRFASRSFDDELERSVTGDIPLAMAMVAVIVVYTAVSLGQLDCVQSKVCLGLCGILSVLMALTMAFGLCAAMGVTYSSLNQILPFLILGIGIDDMFILVHSFDTICRCHEASEAERLARALSFAGPPITMTSLTSFVAFSLSAASQLPAISAFAIYAAASVLCDFLLQITFFVACMMLDRRRVLQQRVDCICCVHNAATPVRQKKTRMRKWLKDVYAPFLMRPLVQAAVVICFGVILAWGIYGTTQLEQGIRIPDDVVSRDSYLIPFFRADELYFKELGDPLMVVLETFDYSSPEKQASMQALARSVLDSQLVTPPMTSWFAGFGVWLSGTPHNASVTADGLITTSSPVLFYALLEQFISGTSGIPFRADIDFMQSGDIKASRLRTDLKRFDSTTTEKNAMLTLRDVAAASTLPARVFSRSFLFLEQYVIIVKDTGVNLALACGSMVMVTVLFLVDPRASLLTMLAVVMINVELFGVMYLWNVRLNSVSLTVLVMGIGLSVDYCGKAQINRSLLSLYWCVMDSPCVVAAHVVHAFMDDHGIRTDRAQRALVSVGSSVLNGATSTLLGVCMLALARSSVFEVFFRILFSLICLGVLHAMVLLPALLSCVGPVSLRDQDVPPCQLARIDRMAQGVNDPEQAELASQPQ